ncbi:MAG: hypothetical protein GXX83_03845 [Gaiellales bacterium]|nr:hypothetical protein [Gaiellales bacterium]
MRPVRRGNRGSEVLDIQTRLQALGYRPGQEGIDGVFGPQTERAVRAFQQQRLILVDGIVGENTWMELVEAGYRLGDRLLYLRQPFMRGDDVLTIQQILNELGFDCGPEDGIFRQRTEDGLMEFQRNTGLNTDGMVGEATIAQLKRLKKSAPEGKKTVPDRLNGYVGHHTWDGVGIVIDPDWGDAGAARGINGLLEKDVNLAVAFALQDLVEDAGASCRLLRLDDHPTGLYEKLEMAQGLCPHLFVSIGHGRDPNPAVHGAAAFYFARESYFSESGRRLAGYMVDSLVRGLGSQDLHVHGRSYACLRELNCVSVRAEPGYITNPEEGLALATPERAAEEASCLFAGIQAFLQRL